MYVKNLESPLAPKNPVLCGFSRVHVKKGERKTVEIPVREDVFYVVDEEGNRHREGKRFLFYAGCSQPDERSRELTGCAPVEIPVEW